MRIVLINSVPIRPRAASQSLAPLPYSAAPELPADSVRLSDPKAEQPLSTNVPIKERSWHDELIYMIMTDRYCNGDKTNDGAAVPNDPKRFHGGDFQGIIDKLDYLRDLGVTALWISPPQLQKRDFFGMDGYHGYWPIDFHQTDPSFGSMEKLKEVVDGAHQRGMRVVMDMVLNHTGYDAPISQDPTKYDWFHHYGNSKLPTKFWMEKGQFCGLPDFAQENPECGRWLVNMCKWWIDKTGIDGMRLDAVRHVPETFWHQLSTELHQHAGDDFLLVGEIYHPKPAMTAPYQNKAGLDSVFDFPLNYAVRDAIAHNEKENYLDNLKFFKEHVTTHPGESFRLLMGRNDGDMRRIARVLEQDDTYRRPDMLVTMLDNHDMTRFVTAAGPNGQDKLKLALTLLMTMRGIPCVYYGTEVGMQGHWEENRKDMEFGKDDAMQAFFTRLAEVRKESVALRRGTMQQLAADHDCLAYARVHPRQTAVVALNNSPEPQDRSLPAPHGLADGTVLQSATDGRTWKVEDGHIQVTLNGREAAIMLHSEPELSGSGAV